METVPQKTKPSDVSRIVVAQWQVLIIILSDTKTDPLLPLFKAVWGHSTL